MSGERKLNLRGSVYRGEIENAFKKTKVKDKVQAEILERIFDGAHVGFNEQFVLKGNLNTEENLRDAIKEKTKDDKVIECVVEVFLVSSDLKMPLDLLSEFSGGNGNVALFVGAGPSIDLGYPTWQKLGSDAMKELYDTGYINAYEKERLEEKTHDPKQKLTIFEQIAVRKDEHKKRSDSKLYKRFYGSKFGSKKRKKESKNIYDLLVGFDAMKITTNIDDEFHLALKNAISAMGRSVGFKVGDEVDEIELAKRQYRDFPAGPLDEHTIYHIHGHVEDLDEIVMGTRDYVRRYYSKDKNVPAFLRNVFKNYTVVFVGYGISEFPILEGLLKEGRRHYALMGAYLNEQNVIRMNQAYFETLNIEVIPYYLDFAEHKRLYVVLESWLRAISDVKHKSPFVKYKEVDEADQE